jgi:deoxyribonuclease-4
MPRFGAHLSIAGGVDQAVTRAREIRAETLQLFVKSPSQWRFAPLADEEVRRFRADARDAGLAPLVGHASYLVNLASPDPALWERSCRCVLGEWDRAERLGLDYLVLHPGAHMDSGEAAGLAQIARALERLRRERPGHTVKILLETTAGAGTVLCGRIEHLEQLITSCDPPQNAGRHGHAPLRGHANDRSTCATAGLVRPCRDSWLGVCVDTCHLWAAGYDLRTRQAIDDLLGRLDEAVGLARVAVVHANDARGGLGSHLDRHAHIGRGRLGRETFRLLVHHPALAALPFILETPKEDARGRKMDPVNLRTLRRLARQVE